MLIPTFEVTQTDSDVLLRVRAPLANVTSTELTVLDDLVVFYSSPYYLRINLPGNVMSMEGETGKYICGLQEFLFVFKKVNPGEHFRDLDMIGKLLIPSKKHQSIKPDIRLCDEVVPSSDPESEDELWYIHQEVTTDNPADTPRYGFANKAHHIGKELRHEFREILDFVDYENTLTDDRSLLREANELAKFSEDHYLADLMDMDEINAILEWEPPMISQSEGVKFDSDEKELLKSLGNRDYLLDSKEKKIVLLSLVDILFAYAYNQRTTFGEDSVESAWTINKISSTLSWLQSFNSMEEVKISCARRSLIFPLYRNWQLTMAVFEDTLNLLKSGRRQLIKCFLKIYNMFVSSEPRYLLNQLYIIDYCIWLQKVSDKKIKHLADLFAQVNITKRDVRLELEELEEAALIVQEEEEMNIANRLQDITLSDSETNSSEGSDSEETDDESSSTISGSSSDLDSDDISSEED